MTIEVELYRPPGYQPAGRRPLAPLLREAFEPILGRSLSRARFRLQLVRVDDRREIAGHPTLVNLRGSHGFVRITIIEDGEVIYQHPDTVAEIIARPLQRLLAAEHPEVEHWGFGLVGPGLQRLNLTRPTPEIAGTMTIRSDGGQPRASHVRELPEPDPAGATLRGLGVNDPVRPLGLAIGKEPRTGVVVRPAARDLLLTHEFSMEVEEGGFVIGRRFADTDQPGRDLLEVTTVVRAESTGASLLRFTFTGESFLRLGELLARRGDDEQILGWYHTHLFAATGTFGLSGVDVRLHTSTFRRPWQVAALVNLTAGGRVLRWYGSRPEPDQEMAEIPYWLADTRPSRTTGMISERTAEP
jgi:JAB N-terminal domain